MSSANLSRKHPSLASIQRRKAPISLQGIRFMFAKFGPIFPKSLGYLAYRFWFSTKRKPKLASEQNFLFTADETYSLMVSGHRVPVYVWGEEGPTILLVHGWEGRAAQFGPLVSPLVALGYRVIGFDAPGHGNAQGSRTDLDEIRYVISTIAANESQIHGAIAHSFGAISTMFAMSQGLELKKVVLISAPCEYEFIVKTVKSMLALPDKVAEEMVIRTRKKFAHWPKSLEDIMNIDRNIPKFPCRALVIHDRSDPVIPIEQGKRISNAWPDSEWMATQGLGHSKILEDGQVAKRIASFMQAMI